MAITCFVADMKTMAYSTQQQPWFFSLSSLSQSSNHTAETNRNKGSNFLVDLDIPLELKTETEIEYLWWYKCWKFMSFLLLKKLFTQLFMSTNFFDPLQYKGNNGTLLRLCLQSIFRNNAEKRASFHADRNLETIFYKTSSLIRILGYADGQKSIPKSLGKKKQRLSALTVKPFVKFSVFSMCIISFLESTGSSRIHYDIYTSLERGICSDPGIL